jgi:hypothetical protein
LRDVLVLVPGKVVDSVHVSPVNNLWQVVLRVDVPGVWGSLDLTMLEDGLLNTASAGGWGVLDWCIDTVVSGLRELVDSLVIASVVLLSVSGGVPLSLGPGIFGSGPSAIGLDSDVVGASADTEETFLTPVGTPRVSYEPVRLSIFFAITNNGDIVDNVGVTSLVAENAASVVLKSLRNGNTASNRSSLVDFLHHVLLTGDVTELINSVDEILVGDEASLTWVAVTADVHGGANLSVVETTSAVDGASLISDFVLGHPLEGVVSLTTVASLVGSLTRDDDLRGDVHIGPGGLSSDLYAIGKS